MEHEVQCVAHHLHGSKGNGSQIIQRPEIPNLSQTMVRSCQWHNKVIIRIYILRKTNSNSASKFTCRVNECCSVHTTKEIPRYARPYSSDSDRQRQKETMPMYIPLDLGSKLMHPMVSNPTLASCTRIWLTIFIEQDDGNCHWANSLLRLISQ